MVKTNLEIRDVQDAWEWFELANEERWTDGLPVLPPEEERVNQFLEAVGEDPGQVVSHVAPTNAPATLETVAVNCVMAGCRPAYVPFVVEALKCMEAPEFNLPGVQTTTNPCAPLTMVSGPVVEELDFNYKDGVFGGGSRANATIGRAVRLILWNVGGARPGANDKSSLGQPGKYTFCVAENREQSPWPPIHTDFGHPEEANAVTVFACDPPHTIICSGNSKRVAKVLARSVANVGSNMFHAAGQYLMAIGPRPAQRLAERFTKEEFRKYLYENARWRKKDVEDLMVEDELAETWWGDEPDQDWVDRQDPEARLPMVQEPEDIHLLVTGGIGQWWAAFLPGWGNYGGYAVSRTVTTN